MNRTDNQLLLESLQPIQAPLQPIYTIALDFMVVFLTVASKDILWAIAGYNAFNAMFATICKTSKRKLFISGNKRYSAED